MKRSHLWIAFLIVRLVFSAGYVWIVHNPGPVLAAVTLKVKSRYLGVGAPQDHLDCLSDVSCDMGV